MEYYFLISIAGIIVFSWDLILRMWYKTKSMADYAEYISKSDTLRNDKITQISRAVGLTLIIIGVVLQASYSIKTRHTRLILKIKL